MDPITTALIVGGGVSLGSSLIGGLFNSFSQRSNNNLQRDLVEATNKNQLNIAREQMQAQYDMLQENNEFNAAEAEKTRAWNSLPEQVARARSAGINPGVLLSQGAQPVTAAQASASGVPNVNLPHLQTAQTNAPQFPLNIFEGLKTLMEARKAGVESDRLQKLVDEEFRNLQLSNKQQEILNEFLPEMQKAVVRKNLGQAFSYEKQAELFAEQGMTEKTQQAVHDAMKAYYEASSRMNDANGKLLLAKAETWREEIRSRLATEETQRGLNRSLASLNDEQKNMVHESFRDAFRKNEVLDMLNARLTAGQSSAALEKYMSVYEKSIYEGLNQSVHEGRITESQYDKLKATLPSLIQQAKDDAAKGHPWSSEYFIDKLLNSAGAAVGAAAYLVK